ncbi:MAG: aldehyde dehydrogenase family protein, partial [Burkholderiales bacterium]
MVTTFPLEPPALLPNLVDGDDVVPAGATVARTSPHDGRTLWELPCSSADDVADLVGVARDRAASWAATAAPARGETLRRLADTIETHADALAEIVARETGKSPKDA